MTKIVDLQGRVMFPGFVDPHVHMCFTMFRHWLDLSPFVNDNMDAVKKRLNEHL
jgi:predicted amidohydrolase YtcJ